MTFQMMRYLLMWMCVGTVKKKKGLLYNPNFASEADNFHCWYERNSFRRHELNDHYFRDKETESLATSSTLSSTGKCRQFSRLALDYEKVVPLAPEMRFLAAQQNVLSLEMTDELVLKRCDQLSAQRIKDFITGLLTFSFLLLHILVNDIS